MLPEVMLEPILKTMLGCLGAACPGKRADLTPKFADRRMVLDAYARTKGPVAFLDESYQAPKDTAHGEKTFYIFTAVLVATKDFDALRDGLVEIAGERYWHTTDALRDGRLEDIRDMLEFLGDGGEPCVIAHKVAVANEDAEAELARKICYQALAVELASGRPGAWDPVDLLLMEERNQSHLKNNDAATHKALVTDKRIPRQTRLLQVSPAAELLLWLPDVVSSVFRRTLTHSDETSQLFDVVKDQVHFVRPG